MKERAKEEKLRKARGGRVNVDELRDAIATFTNRLGNRPTQDEINQLVDRIQEIVHEGGIEPPGEG